MFASISIFIDSSSYVACYPLKRIPIFEVCKRKEQERKKEGKKERIDKEKDLDLHSRCCPLGPCPFSFALKPKSGFGIKI
jgi:hypothetical protein